MVKEKRFSEITQEIIQEIKLLNPTHKIVKDHKVISILNKYETVWKEDSDGHIYFYPKSTEVLSNLATEGLKAEANTNRLASLRKLTELSFHHFVLSSGYDASENQDIVFNVLNQTNLNVVIEAVAGSGKTTTIVDATLNLLRYTQMFLNRTNRIGFFCFNTSIRDELAKRLPEGVSAYTLHQYGLMSIFRSGKKVLVNEHKLDPILEYFYQKWFNVHSPSFDRAEADDYVAHVEGMVNLFRLCDGKSEADVIAIADKYSIPYDGLFAGMVMQVLSEMKSPKRDYKYAKTRLKSCFGDKNFLKEVFGVDVKNKHYKATDGYKESQTYLLDMLNIIDMFHADSSMTVEELRHKVVRNVKSYKRKILEVFDFIFELLEKCIDVDFADMLYVAATDTSVNLSNFDTIFIDEAQDLSWIQIAMLEKMLLKPGTRIVAVGDTYQSIYGFAGSDSKCFKYLKNRMNTITIPLSVSYRCSIEAVKLAQTINSLIKWFSGAKQGEVRDGLSTELNDKENCAVLCRQNAPLVSFLYKLITQRKSAHIAGKDFADSLIKHIRRYKTISDMLKKMEADEQKIVRTEMATKHITEAKAMKSEVYLRALDKRMCFVAIIENTKSKTLNELEAEISKIFFDEKNEKKKGIILSSMHKSKGLEWDKVFILCNELNSAAIGRCKQDWQVEQEYNLLYVAYTRTKDWLIFITDFSYDKENGDKTAITSNGEDSSSKVTDVEFEEVELETYIEKKPLPAIATSECFYY